MGMVCVMNIGLLHVRWKAKWVIEKGCGGNVQEKPIEMGGGVEEAGLEVC